MKRNYHERFLKYQKFIIGHETYSSIPEPINIKNGAIKWVAAGKSALGKKRTIWWEEKKQQLIKEKVLTHKSGYTDVARTIHPTRKKPCQTCGKSLFIDYEYLANRTREKIILNFPKIELSTLDTLSNCLLLVNKHYKEEGLKEFVALFNLNLKNETNIKQIEKTFKEKKKVFLSPGFMGNPPDRLDGLHSYGICCRSTQDTGRHKDNLQKYGEDRRAYESWCDGDWKAASFYMRAINKKGSSADHIGPISLGFIHDPINLQPLSSSDNSSKRNRLYPKDLNNLKTIEKKSNTSVMSWHTQMLWDKKKNKILSQDQALAFSKELRKHNHRVLLTLYELKQRGFNDFLLFLLNVDYALYKIEIESLVPLKINKIESRSKTHMKNLERYKRIAFESLDKYQDKNNRRHANISSKNIKKIILELETIITHQGFSKAKNNFEKILNSFLK